MYDEQKIEEICNYYCGDNMKKLRKMCHKKIKSLSYRSEADYDDFLSKANETVYLAAKKYDEAKNNNFEAFLMTCINKKFISESRYNKKKNIPLDSVVFLDQIVIKGNKKMILGDILPSDFDLFEEAFGNTYFEEGLIEILNRFSESQSLIVSYIINGYSNNEIKDILSMPKEQFNKELSNIKEILVLK